MVQAVNVVSFLRAIDAERNTDAFRREAVDRLFVEQCAVRLKGEVYFSEGWDRLLNPPGRLTNASGPGQQRLTAVEDYDQPLDAFL